MADNFLDVYLYGKQVGEISQDNKGQITFQYSSGATHALSLSLPINSDKIYNNNECNGFFNGLLPEGENVRKAVGNKYGVNPKNDFSLLKAIGYDCAGAVSFISVDEINKPSKEIVPNGKILSNEELATFITELPKKPLALATDGLRLSLAGAQDKSAVIMIGGNVAIPSNNVPTSHILKPKILNLNETIENEYICMQSAKEIGINVPHVGIRAANGVKYLLVERYDRCIEHGKIERIHQEDFCQASNIASAYKYQVEGGVGFKTCFEILQKTYQPAKSILMFLNMIVYNYLIGNNDAHGKNFSIMHYADGKISLAPAYDILCTQAYPELTSRMAMKIGSRYEPSEVFERHFQTLATDANINYTLLKKVIKHQVDILPDVVDKVSSSINNTIGSKILEIVTSNCNTLKSRLNI